MEIDFKRETLAMDLLVREEVSEALIEEEYRLAEDKPGIFRILHLDMDVDFPYKEVITDRLSLEGVLSCNLLYLDNEFKLHFADWNIPFTHYIDMEGVTSLMKAEVTGFIEHSDYSVSGERKIEVKALIKIKGRVLKEEKLEVVTEIGEDFTEYLRTREVLTSTVGENVSKTVIKEEFEIPENKPLPQKVLKPKIKLKEKELKISDNKVISQGNLSVSFLYTTEDKFNPVEKMSFEVPFAHFVEIEGALSYMIPRAEYHIEDISWTLKENKDGVLRMVEVEAVISMHASVKEENSRELLLDAYNLVKNLEVKRTEIVLEKLISTGKNQNTLKFTMELPKNREVHYIFDTEIKTVVSDVRISEDRVLIDGFLNLCLFYVTRNPDYPVYCHTKEVPFKHFIEMKGIEENMKAEVNLDVQNVSYIVVTPSEVELKVVIEAEGRVMENKSMHLVVAAEEVVEVKEEKKKGNIIIYIVQEGDTLWDIAKRYRVSLEDVKNLNQIEDVKPGEKLLIPRKVLL